MGSPSTSELTDTQIENALDSAVNEYSRYKPKRVYTEFETEAHKAEVELTAVIPGSAVLEVVDCFYDPTGVFWDSDLYYTLPGVSISGLSGISMFHNPSIVLQYQQKLEAFKHYFGGDWDFYDGTLRLLPPPSSSGIKVGIIANCLKGLADIPDVEEDTLLLWAEAQAGKLLAEKRARIASINMEGASVNLDAGQVTLKLAEQKEKEFRRRLSGYLGAFSIG